MEHVNHQIAHGICTIPENYFNCRGGAGGPEAGGCPSLLLMEYLPPSVALQSQAAGTPPCSCSLEGPARREEAEGSSPTAPRTQGLLPLEADRAGGQCQALLLVPVPCPLSCKAGTPSFPHQTKLQLGPLLRLPGAKTALVSVANSRWAVCVVLLPSCPLGHRRVSPCGLHHPGSPLLALGFLQRQPLRPAAVMPPSGLQLVLLRGSHRLLLCSVQPQGRSV